MSSKENFYHCTHLSLASVDRSETALGKSCSALQSDKTFSNGVQCARVVYIVLSSGLWLTEPPLKHCPSP